MERTKTETFKLDSLEIIMLRMIEGMERVAGPLTDEQLEEVFRIESEIREEYGGQRVRIPKRGKHPPQEQRARIVHEALNSDASDLDLTQRFGISRSTLYRYIKRG